MIYLSLFFAFFKIGLFTFGGGYAMISIIRETVTSHGWLTDGRIMDIIAVSESTPGPIAVNMATFVGSSQGGILGSFCATLGVVLPSFIIILIIASLIQNMLKNRYINGFIVGVRPCVVALILTSSIIMGLKTLFGISSVFEGITVDFKGIIILFITFLIMLIYKKFKSKSISPIILIVISAIIGMAIY